MTIKEMRQAAGMTQNEFAEYIGVTKSAVEKWEYGHAPEHIRALIEYKLKTEELIMETVKIYTIEQTQGVMASETGSRFSLDPWGENTDTIKGSDNGGADYIIPAGYTVGEDVTGRKHFYTDRGEHCPLISFGHTPAIIDCTKPENPSRILLKRA